MARCMMRLALLWLLCSTSQSLSFRKTGCHYSNSSCGTTLFPCFPETLPNAVYRTSIVSVRTSFLMFISNCSSICFRADDGMDFYRAQASFIAWGMLFNTVVIGGAKLLRLFPKEHPSVPLAVLVLSVVFFMLVTSDRFYRFCDTVRCNGTSTWICIPPLADYKYTYLYSTIFTIAISFWSIHILSDNLVQMCIGH